MCLSPHQEKLLPPKRFVAPKRTYKTDWGSITTEAALKMNHYQFNRAWLLKYGLWSTHRKTSWWEIMNGSPASGSTEIPRVAAFY